MSKFWNALGIDVADFGAGLRDMQERKARNSMSEKKFTPGPWHVGVGNGEGYVFCDGSERMAYTPSGTVLQAICKVNGDMADDKANAVLIAAAPDLLAALEEAMQTIQALHGPLGWDIYSENAPEMKRLKAALAKARGEA